LEGKKQQKTRIKTENVAEKAVNVVIGRKKATKTRIKTKNCCWKVCKDAALILAFHCKMDK